MKPSEKSRFPIYFLIITIIIYLIITLFNQEIIINSLIEFKNIFISIIPTLIFIIILMIISDFFLDENKIQKISKKLIGIKGWLISGISGIISAGPIYIWYPFLSNLKNKGIKQGYLIAFLYNRAIKIPQIPMMLLIYNIQFITILFIVMFIFSIVQGLIGEKILEKWK